MLTRGRGGGLVPPGQEFNVWGLVHPPDRHIIACRGIGAVRQHFWNF